ncbi:PstS family phosphate ABC transporter substrate-binding protein [Altericista sp. CCNU0014]|uniref:PstS family phosphate ABC transporter substrate-binding protein n=1 Tax=Altericista sp. CCNU0014 TaxID=3082949 RepID=UPI00384CA230
MEKHRRDRVNARPNPSIFSLFAFLALIWSFGLVGGGVWSFLKQSEFSSAFLPKVLPDGQRFARVQNVPTGLFNYGGSTAWASIRLMVDPIIQAERREFRLRYLQPEYDPVGSSSGIEMLLDGRLSFAQTSRPLRDEEYRLATERGLKLEQIPVAIDGVTVAVNPNLNISGLTLDQLRSIYSGRTTNWQEVGGPDLDILPYSRPLNADGTTDFFVRDILQRQEFGTTVEFIYTTTQALRILANTPGAVYYASASEIVPQCTVKAISVGRGVGDFVSPYQPPAIPSQQCPQKRNQVNIQAFQSGQYPLTRNLYVVLNRNDGADEAAGQAYTNFLLTAQGQELIRNAGFVAIR